MNAQNATQANELAEAAREYAGQENCKMQEMIQLTQKKKTISSQPLEYTEAAPVNMKISLSDNEFGKY